MIRQEALGRAIEIAQDAFSRLPWNLNPEIGVAMARVGELWLGISDRLPIEEEVAVEPVPDPHAPVGDEATVTAMCDHGQHVFLSAGRWWHSIAMTPCDSPPIKEPGR